ncbi:hypothetical protein D5400_12700 [Georhizobium profundi]|uniref:Uncharacterized protein n=1 Tax=Georhizobium profundi TaxID=2341112 RepID=A0A3Q8XRB5_9HYPH|nr:hypothetical protein [Georhizobium profundi]AZN72023.1 hypothetical protein D5400_12700 [Georhizobium profundi]
MDGQKVRHHSIRASIEGLWIEYLYGDGWRLVEIVLGLQIIGRAIAILFFGGMTAGYYETFPFVDHALEWGLTAFGIGVARISGTIINGRWKRSPRLRWACGVAAFLYQGLHCFFFWQIGLSVIAIGYLLWTVFEGMAITRSTIDIARKRNEGCQTG